MGNLAPAGEVISATPQDIVSFLIWKDNFGRTKIHREGCQFFCTKVKSACSCQRRLAFGQVDCMIGKLSSIFSAAGRGGDDSTIPGHGNPAASRVVKDYLAAMRVEQLEARIVPTQADPIFISDLAAIAAFIGQQVNENVLSATQFFVLIRDQAFLKTLFFAGDRAGDLGKVKTQELLYSNA